MGLPLSLRLVALMRSLRWWLIAAALVFFIVAGGRSLRVDTLRAGETGVLGSAAEGRWIVTTTTVSDGSALPIFPAPRPPRHGDLVRVRNVGIVEVVALPGARLGSWRRPDGTLELKRDQTLTGIIVDPDDSSAFPPSLGVGSMLVRGDAGTPGLRVVDVGDAVARVLFLLGG